MKFAVVTGAASGIGEDCARDLLARGWTVFCLDRSWTPAQQDAGQAGRARWLQVPCDVTVASDVERAFAVVGSHTTQLDALVCSAGIFRTGPLLAMSETDFDALFAVNTKGAWLCARAALPLLKQANGGAVSPRIVFVASIAAIRPKVGGGAYAASKVALTHMARVLAVELAGQGILVNAIAPATVDTPMTRRLNADADVSGYVVSGTSPLGRVATPADITPVVRFLLSEESRYLTGAVIPVDGGTSAAFSPKAP